MDPGYRRTIRALRLQQEREAQLRLETRMKRCSSCDYDVLETKRETMHNPIWDRPEHNGPCGRPCVGGGIPHLLAKIGRYHGGNGQCECKETP